MSPKSYKAFLAGVMLALLVGVSFTQNALVRERQALGLNRYTELRGAPPVLALTTVAFGGFRGLISNVLWMRATRLQEENKYFEMVQLADWITKLEPHFTQVWLMEGWNMAFNISVEFSDPADRWRWVERGMELMRDEGLHYNPYDVMLHRELAWLFEFKMGGNMDDAQMFYKRAWVLEMQTVFKSARPNWDELINPQTDDARRRAALLRDKYKMDPQLMKEVDDKYGPLEWRLPEAHAIYWAVQGLKMADENKSRINPSDLITLRRIIYQSLNIAFQRGRLITVKLPDNSERMVDLGPNLDLISKANDALEEAMVNEEPDVRKTLEMPHQFFLMDAVFYLYVEGREADATRWYRYLGDKYPDAPLLQGMTNAHPGNTTLLDYTLARLEQEVQSPSEYKTRYILEGLERQSYLSLMEGDDTKANTLDSIAQTFHQRYDIKTRAMGTNGVERLPMPPLSEIRHDVLTNLLSSSLPLEGKLILESKTGLTNFPIQIPNPPPTNSPAPPP